MLELARSAVDQASRLVWGPWTIVLPLGTSSVGALTILASGVWNQGLDSTALIAAAFDRAMPDGGAEVAI